MKVISVPLYGENPLYLGGASRLVREAHLVYPDFSVRVFAGARVSRTVLAQLERQGAQVVVVPDELGSAGMFWRLNVFEDPAVEVALMRDVDSIPTEREVMAVRDWLASGRAFHIMRDHPRHAQLMMGGMWGARGADLHWIPERSRGYFERESLGADQRFLRRFVYSAAIRDSVVHDSVFSVERHRLRFPSPRCDGEYVGEVVQADGTIDESFRQMCIRSDESVLLRARADWDWRLRRAAKRALRLD